MTEQNTKDRSDATRRRDEVFEELGRILFEEMEHLDPSVPDARAEWRRLTRWRRSFYVNCVERLFEERDLVDIAYKLANTVGAWDFGKFSGTKAGR